MRYRQIKILSDFKHSLRGLCVDSHDNLYAAGDSEIQVFDPTGTLHHRWPTEKPPWCVAVAPNGRIYTGATGQIQIFEQSGKSLPIWRDPTWRGEITAIGFLNNGVLVAETKDRSIRRYDNKGALVATIGKNNLTVGFLIPNGVLDFSVDSAGVIHAANPGKHRVERYNADGKLLGHIGHFDGVKPEGFPGCCNPTNLKVGPDGMCYVTEKAGPRAKVLDADGKLIAVIADEVFDRNAKNMAIAVGSKGRVFVGDSGKMRIYVYDPA